MGQQQTLAMAAGFEKHAKRTRRAEFLQQMNVVVPWRELCAEIEPFYPKAGNGRPPVGLERMANVNDAKVLPQLLHGQESAVWGDQAYQDNSGETAHRGDVKYGINSVSSLVNAPVCGRRRGQATAAPTTQNSVFFRVGRARRQLIGCGPWRRLNHEPPGPVVRS